MRVSIFMVTTLAGVTFAHANHYPLLCVNEERVEKVLCPVSVTNEQIKACECPEGMSPFQFEPGDNNPTPAPSKASGS